MITFMHSLPWRPIAEAPRNDLPVVVWRPTAPEIRRIGVDRWRIGWHLSRPNEQPTHWAYIDDLGPEGHSDV